MSWKGVLWLGVAAAVGSLVVFFVKMRDGDGEVAPKDAVEEAALPDKGGPLQSAGARGETPSARHSAKSGRKPPGHLTPIDIMMRSLEQRPVEEFTAAQVDEWEVGEPEEYKGEIHSTGLVVYRAETIFGEKKVRAKAYIKDGEVRQWIWPKTGMEIRWRAPAQ